MAGHKAFEGRSIGPTAGRDKMSRDPITGELYRVWVSNPLR